MAAATILESIPLSPEGSESDREHIHIDLFEKNTSLGKKVIISGGGRCNVTTGIEDKKILATKYTRGWQFIRKAMGVFSPKKCREWFESHGVPLYTQEDDRVFPVSDDGHDIV
jgi:predicted flavoprotein YhiN